MGVNGIIHFAFGLFLFAVNGFECPEGFDDLPGVNMCLLKVPKDVSWFEARENCIKKYGAELASFLTLEEQKKVVEYMGEPPFKKTDGQRTEKARFWWHWLDATNDNPEEEWRWNVKGKEIPLSVTPTHWDFEEPANSIGCLVMQAGIFGFDKNWRHWKSYDCYWERPYLCQIRYTGNEV